MRNIQKSRFRLLDILAFLAVCATFISHFYPTTVDELERKRVKEEEEKERVRAEVEAERVRLEEERAKESKAERESREAEEAAEKAAGNCVNEWVSG